MTEKIRQLIVLVLLIGTAGCATLFAPEEQAVPVRSQPAGAEVFLDGERVGRTPLILTLRREGTYRLRLVHGGQERTATLTSEVSGTYLALDVLPGLGLAGASIALATACDDPYVCLFAASAASTGIAVGLGASASASATDAISGAWIRLRPVEVAVNFP